MDGPDFYAVLGVEPGATTEQVKTVYRRRLTGEHPDRVQAKASSEQYAAALVAWQRVTEAYNTLVDPDLRRSYDLKRAEARRPRPPFRADDFMRDFMGRRPPVRGVDERAELPVAFMVALKGGKVVFRNFTISIPMGVAEGQVLKLSGKGGAGSPPGDLHVVIILRDHPVVRRDTDGVTLLMDLPVTWFEAYRSSTGYMKVPTPWGDFLWRHEPGEIVEGGEVVFEGFGVRRFAEDRRHHLRATVRLIPPTAGDLALQQVLQRLQETTEARAMLAAMFGGA